MKNKTKKRILLAFALSVIMLFAMSITSLAADKVTGVKQTKATTNSATIEWASVLGASGYRIEKSTDGVNWVLDCEQGTTYLYCTVRNLNPGQLVYARVRARYGSYGSYTYGEPSATIQVCSAVSEPTNLVQTDATSGSVTLKWDAMQGATGYEIYADYSRTNLLKTVTTNTATIKAAAGSAKHYYVFPVKTTSSGFKSIYGYKSVYAKAAPGKVSGVGQKGYYTWKPYSSEVSLSWKRNANDQWSAEGFKVEIYTVNGKKKLKTYYARSIYQDVKLSSIKNKGFQVRVAGYVTVNNKKCLGTWSSKAVVLPNAKVSAVKNSYNSSAKTFKIKWKKVPGAKKYVVYGVKNRSSSILKSNTKFKKLTTTKSTSYTLTGIQSRKYTHVYVCPVVKVGSKYVTAKSGGYTYYYYPYTTYSYY